MNGPRVQNQYQHNYQYPYQDLNRDGICDGKESAIGLKKLHRKRKGNPHR